MADTARSRTPGTASPGRKKTAAKRKSAANSGRAAGRRPAAKRGTAARKRSRKATPDFAARAQEAGRNAFLASLGFYGKAFDQAQEQFSHLQEQLEERRGKAETLYQELVRRGRKVEKDAREALQEIELPGLTLDSLTDRKRLDDQLDKARARFEELKENMGLKSGP
jgi:lipid II:glycine glycyltransferase (peptidoglycan interpeptide bridge formation enzyme)